MSDNDARHLFDTGAVRSADRDAERWDLISPIGLKALARTYAEGAAKFGMALMKQRSRKIIFFYSLVTLTKLVVILVQLR